MARALGVDALVGRELAGYRLDSVLGQGGMSVVYLAEHRHLGRVVALKVLSPALADSTQFRERFLRESRIAAGLNHPNAIPIHDAGEADGLLYIAMRYVEATDLAALLDATGRLEPSRALSIVGQAAAALDAAHASGLVHRDVKPANVLVAEGDHAYLTDFGIAKDTLSTVGDATVPGQLLGTVDYVAPEQIDGSSVDWRADVYSLTCVLYECFTGDPPYSRGGDLAVLWAHMQSEPPTISSTRPELGAALDLVVARGLAKEPGDRYGSCRELVEAASAALPQRSLRELPPELDSPVPLLGRAEELAWLLEGWERARAGCGGIVLLAGARGMGKTRLSGELARHVQSRGGTVRYAGFVGPARPSEPAVEALIEASEPTLVVLDDLDAADAPAVAAIVRQASRIQETPVLVLGTYRAGEDPLALAATIEIVAPSQRRQLGPIGVEDIRLIAESYAAGAPAELDADTVLAATGGVPRTVHEVVGEWARGEAARRLASAAERAATGRSDRRAAALALEANIAELQRVREQTSLSTGAEGGADGVTCPFKGLASFDATDAELFFGRERLVAELVARLVGSTLLGVVGPSGSGKSSVVRAGLVPALATGILPGSSRWVCVVLRPGTHPVAALADAVAAAPAELPHEPDPLRALGRLLGAGERAVLVIDQFEETFTACQDETERAAFVASLLTAARDPQSRFIVVAAVRADFYGRCAAYPELAELLAANHVLVGPMQPEELRRAIELPARRVGLRVERGLVDALVADVADEPGGLPLLSTALLELWQDRDDGTLSLARYGASGGIRGAVARLAERAYARLTPPQQAIARGMLLRLGSGDTEAPVRRRVPLVELDLATSEDTGTVLATLTDNRLVTVHEGAAEVAHEALLREWPRLRGWLEEDVQGRRLREHLTNAATAWDEVDHDASELYRGPRLAAALEWQADHTHELNALERRFLDESRAAAEGETRRVRRTNRRLRVLLAGVALLLGAALAAGSVALVQRGRARDAAASAEAQRLGAQALVEDELDRSLLLARQGVVLDDSVETESNLLAALLRSPAAIGVAQGEGGRVHSLALSPDGTLLAADDHQGTVLLFDAQTLARRGKPVHAPGQAFAVAFSPDSRTLAVGGGARTQQAGFIVLIDVATTTEIERISVEGQSVREIAYSPDGTVLATAEEALAEGGPLGLSRVVLRDPHTAAETGPVVKSTTTPGLADIAFLPDSRSLLVSGIDGSTSLRDAGTLDPIDGASWDDLAGSPAVAPDGLTAAVGGIDGSLTFLDLGTGDRHEASSQHGSAIEQVRYSEDGTTLATASDDFTAVVWDVASATPRETLRGHGGAVTGIALSLDGTTAYTSSLDGSLITWDLGGSRRLGRPFTFTTEELGMVAVAMSPSGEVVAVSQPGGSVALLDPETLTPLGTPVHVVEGLVNQLAFSPDGRLVAAAGADGTVALLDIASGQLARPPIAAAGRGLLVLAFSPDGRLLATGSESGEVVFWNVATGERIGEPATLGTIVVQLAFHPDGRRLAAARADGQVEIRDVESRERLLSVTGDPRATASVAFSPDGSLLATGGVGGSLKLWDAETGQLRGSVSEAHAGLVLEIGFSPDGSRLFTSGSDGNVSLWDPRSLERIGSPLPVDSNQWVVGAFTPDGTHILAVSPSGRAMLWNVDEAAWERHACQVAGRTLTQAEWNEFLPGRAYEPACG